jgi:hypothetical protein
LRRLDGAKLARARKRLSQGDDHAVLQEIAEEEERVAQLGRDFADRLVSREAFIAAQNAISAKVEALRERLAERAKTSALDGMVDMRAEWDALGLERRRAIIEVVLSGVTISPATGLRNRFDPERIAFTWRA